MAKIETEVKTVKRNFGTYQAITNNLDNMTSGEMVYITDKSIPIPADDTSDAGSVVGVVGANFGFVNTIEHASTADSASHAASADTADSADKAATAEEFEDAATITLNGDVVGSATSKFGWNIETSIPNDSVANAQLVNKKVTIAGHDILLGGSLSAVDLRNSLGLTNALRFVGRATVPIEDGSATDPQIANYDFSKAALGDTIIDMDSNSEFFWDDRGHWELLGSELIYKIKQTPVTDPEAQGTGLTYIASISQNANGDIAATKRTVQNATSTQAGIVSTSSQEFKGTKKFNDGIEVKGDGDAVIHISGTDTTVPYTSIYSTNASGTSRDIILQEINGKVGIGTTTPIEKLHIDGNAQALKFIGQLEGNADTASKLLTPVKINGTDFDGSTDITTDTWGDSINMSINAVANNNSVSVNGSQDKGLNIPTSISGFSSIQSTSFTGNINGNATSANKLNTDAGSNNIPVYFDNGIPVAVEQSAKMEEDHNVMYDNGTSKISIGIGADGVRRGIYDDTKEAWMMYSDADNDTFFEGDLHGNADTATRLNISSDDNAIAKFDDKIGSIITTDVYIDDNNNIVTGHGVTIGSDTNKNTGNKLDVEGKTVINTTTSSSVNNGLEVNNGLIKVSNYDHSVSIGPTNANFIHFTSSASKPFLFNTTTQISGNVVPTVDSSHTSGNGYSLGTSSSRWKNVYVGTSDTYGSSTKPIYWNNGVPVAITSYEGNSATATKFASAQNVNLTGDVSGSASSQAGWNITTSIGEGKVTNAMLAGSIANNKLVNSKVTVAGNDISLGGNVSASTLRESLGLSNALHFIGTATVDITEGSTIDPAISGYDFSKAQNGDVIIDKNEEFEFVWTGKWERLGGNGSYKIVQEAIASPTADGTEIAFIDTISQNKNGNITATKKTIRDAGALQSGVVNTSSQTFAGTKTFNDGIFFNDDTMAYNSKGIVFSSGSRIAETTNKDLTIFGGNKVTLKPISSNGDSNLGIEIISNALYPILDEGMALGNADHAWSDAYITTTHGDLDGNAAHADYAESLDDDGIWTWTDGDVDGPTARIDIANVGIDIDAIPKATLSTSGIVTNDVQSFGGEKTFNELTHFNDDIRFENGDGAVLFGDAQHYMSKTDYTGNSATADKLKVARAITIGNTSKNFDGSAPVSWTLAEIGTEAAYIRKDIGTTAGDIIYWNAAGSPVRLGKGSNGQALVINSSGLPSWGTISTTDTKNTAGSTNKAATKLFLIGAETQAANPQTYSNSAVYISTGNVLMGAAWNDFAEYRKSDITEAGRVIIENGDDSLSLSSERMQPGAEIISDTFGFAIGQTEECQTPITAAGRVLAYGYEDREEFKKNIGRPVCSGPNGTVSIMTDEEYKEKGYCAIGFISAVPEYDEWGENNIKVNNRIWIRIK